MRLQSRVDVGDGELRTAARGRGAQEAEAGPPVKRGQYFLHDDRGGSPERGGSGARNERDRGAGRSRASHRDPYADRYGGWEEVGANEGGGREERERAPARRADRSQRQQEQGRFSDLPERLAGRLGSQRSSDDGDRAPAARDGPAADKDGVPSGGRFAGRLVDDRPAQDRFAGRLVDTRGPFEGGRLVDDRGYNGGPAGPPYGRPSPGFGGGGAYYGRGQREGYGSRRGGGRGGGRWQPDGYDDERYGPVEEYGGDGGPGPDRRRQRGGPPGRFEPYQRGRGGRRGGGSAAARAAAFLDRDAYDVVSEQPRSAAPMVKGKWKHDLFDTVKPEDEGMEQVEEEGQEEGAEGMES